MRRKIKTKFNIGDEVVVPYEDTYKTIYTLAKIRRIDIIVSEAEVEIKYYFDTFIGECSERLVLSKKEFEKKMQKKYGNFKTYIRQINNENYFMDMLHKENK